MRVPMIRYTNACLLLLATTIQLHAEEPFPVQGSIKDMQGRIMDVIILCSAVGIVKVDCP